MDDFSEIFEEKTNYLKPCQNAKNLIKCQKYYNVWTRGLGSYKCKLQLHKLFIKINLKIFLRFWVGESTKNKFNWIIGIY